MRGKKKKRDRVKKTFERAHKVFTRPHMRFRENRRTNNVRSYTAFEKIDLLSFGFAYDMILHTTPYKRLSINYSQLKPWNLTSNSHRCKFDFCLLLLREMDVTSIMCPKTPTSGCKTFHNMTKLTQTTGCLRETVVKPKDALQRRQD